MPIYATSDMYITKTFGNTPVYIFEKHNFAFPIWGEFSARAKRPLTLVSLDSHNDTMPPFRKHYSTDGNGVYNRAKCNKFIASKLVINNKQAFQTRFILEDACFIANALANDEQIKAAFDFCYINECHIVSRDVKCRYEKEDASQGYNISYHFIREGENYLPLEQVSLEQVLCRLTDRLSGKGIILDVDLDFITSKYCFSPISRSYIKLLSQQSIAVTIAREHEYFNCCRIDETFENEKALELLLSVLKE
jgi:hypothetical protein